EGYLRYFADGQATIYSAGIETHGVNPRAIATMMDDGIDISGQTSNNVNEYQGLDFDFVITVCDHAREHCPYFPSGALRLHQNFPDPHGRRMTKSAAGNRLRFLAAELFPQEPHSGVGVVFMTVKASEWKDLYRSHRCPGIPRVRGDSLQSQFVLFHSLGLCPRQRFYCSHVAWDLKLRNAFLAKHE
ncbi:MAG: arsenate reductase ArsC, partial [Alcaligenaceae bacterium]